jgi:hypothetical protein
VPKLAAKVVPMQFRSHKRFGLTFSLFVIAAVWVAYHIRIIGFPTTPFEGSGDTTGWEYSGYFLFENLRFTPFPKLDFFTDTTFYPFGTSAVFQAWGLERDYIYAACRALFGHGPWLYYYVSLARLFCALFIYFLLRARFGNVKAIIAGVGAAFLSFYSLGKFPYHMGISVSHWAMISVFIDCCIVQDYIDKRSIGPHLLLLRIFALVMSLGQEIGYIAGMALSSATICLTYIGVWEISRSIFRRNADTNVFQKSFETARRSWHHSKASLIFLTATVLIATFFIVPLVAQIFVEVKSLETPEMFSGGWWVHPRRIFLPHFEWLNPNEYAPYFEKFGDGIEGYGENAPGWFLLGLAILGLITNPKSIKYHIPFVVLFLMILFYVSFDQNATMKIFPWYKFARVSGRLSFILGPLCLVFFLHSRFFDQYSRKLKTSLRIVAIAAFSLLLFFEVSFVYGKILPPASDFQMPENFMTTMSEIRESPGEALFEWPFCVAGGNIGNFCPSDKILGSYGFRKYHEKKVNGGYFGRLSTKAASTYDESGITELVRAQTVRCLTEPELKFLYDFYKAFDYAGMIVYQEVVTEACLPAIYEVFGKPTRSVQMLSSGLGHYIPKSAEIFAQQNKEYGLKLSYVRQGEIRKIFSQAEATFGPGRKVVIGDFADIRAATDFVVMGTAQRLENFEYVLFEKSRSEPLIGYDIVFSYDDYILHKRSNAGNSLETAFLFVNAFENATRTQILDLKVTNNEIYMHPAEKSASLVFSNVNIPNHATLKFGVALRKYDDGVKFIVRIDDQLLWEKEVLAVSELQNLSVDLGAFAGKSVSVTLEVDPLKTNNGDWSYWLSPIILSSESKGSTKL